MQERLDLFQRNQRQLEKQMFDVMGGDFALSLCPGVGNSPFQNNLPRVCPGQLTDTLSANNLWPLIG